jgi:two-component system sensor histidine kinase FlrB
MALLVLLLPLQPMDELATPTNSETGETPAHHISQTLQKLRSPLKPRPFEESPNISLAHAFETFSAVAGSLENSYLQLQAEVVRLRMELSGANSDLARSLEENRKMRAYLTQLLDALPCGVLVLDAARNVRMVNPAARHMLMLDTAEEGSVPSFLDEFFVDFTKSLPRSTESLESDMEVCGPGGQSRFMCISLARLSRNEGGSCDFVYILRDTTEQKRLEREKETNRNLKALAEMAMVLAHEIRNPLASLELFAGLLSDATRTQPVTHQWVDHLQAGLRTLSATVNNILQFHNSPPTEFASVNIVRLVKETLEFLQPLARQKGIELRLSCCHPDIYIPADPHRLQQVFFNLALNAFRVMARGGVLSVRITWSEEAPDKFLVIEFQDQGPGIAEQDLDKIFQVGFTTHAGSPGLGLAVCKKVVDQHHGTIRVESKPGEGARFLVSLPAFGEA